MKVSKCKLTTVFSVVLAATAFGGPVLADPLFFDDFEDRVRDQPLVGPGWTWYNQAYADNECTEYSSGWGPYDDGDGSDYLQENRNYWTASVNVGQGDSYFRAGLEVPAWASTEGEKVVLSNMLRVYGDQYYDPPGIVSCKRTLIFQEMTVDTTGSFTFSFDVAMARSGAPASGEVTAAFVKVIKTSDFTYEEMLFEKAETHPPVSSTPENASTASISIDFTITDEMIGELLQFGFYNDIVESLGQTWGTAAALYDNVMLDTMVIGPAHSGSWYNPDQDGHGFAIEFGTLPDASPLAIVYWYTYDNQGNPIFMVGSGVPVGNEVVITFDSPSGMRYGDFNSVPYPRDVGGVAVFNFADRENATFSYEPSAFSETTWGHTTPIADLPLVRIFAIPADKYFSTE